MTAQKTRRHSRSGRDTAIWICRRKGCLDDVLHADFLDSEGLEQPMPEVLHPSRAALAKGHLWIKMDLAMVSLYNQ